MNEAQRLVDLIGGADVFLHNLRPDDADCCLICNDEPADEPA
jgi:hypothetical protein